MSGLGSRTTAPLRVAYADPPYPGQSERHYGGVEVDHADLIKRLEAEFPDGWLLSTSANALPEVLALCPQKRPGRRHYHDEDSGVRIAVWNVTNAAPCPPLRRWHCWEPVILRGGRSRCRWSGDLVKDVLAAGNANAGRDRPTLIGQKPPAFCRWMFDLLGLGPDDELVDLFPGSGAVGREWEAWKNQTRLAV